MKSYIQKKLSKDDKGIAIIFSLVMLMIFFLISFGFLASVTSAKTAASARSPKDKANFIASTTILAQAIRALEADGGLATDGSNILTAPNPRKLTKFIMTDTLKDIEFIGWGTNGGVPTNTSGSTIHTALSLHMPTDVGNDFSPDPTDSNWDEITWVNTDLDGDNVDDDHFVWVILHSDKLDANYIGDSTVDDGSPLTPTINSVATPTGRQGLSLRELDISTISPENSYSNAANSATYINWDSIKPWLHKKKLVGSLPIYETAVKSMEVGTSAVPIFNNKMPNGVDNKANLSSFDTTQANARTELMAYMNNWIPDTAPIADENNQLAANILDYLDADTNMETDEDTTTVGKDGKFYGNERVPYINEVGVYINNRTSSTGDSEVKLTLNFSLEFVDMYGGRSTGWGTPDGSGCEAIIRYIVRGVRAGTAFEIDRTSNANACTISPDLEDPANWLDCYSTHNSADIELSTGPVLTNVDGDLTDIEIEITEIELHGDSTHFWDYAIPNAPTPKLLAASSLLGISYACNDPRLNQDPTNWAAAADGIPVNVSLSEVGGSENANNHNYSPSISNNEQDFEVAGTRPDQLSTAYMPLGGGITLIDELGFIHRGFVHQTLNLADYNIENPAEFQGTAASLRPAPNTTNLANTDPSTTNFNKGDRSLLDYVKVNLPSFDQYGAINPNTTDKNTIRLLLKNIFPSFGPYSPGLYHPLGSQYASVSTDYNDDSNLNKFIERFPLIKEVHHDPTPTIPGDRVIANQFNIDEFDSNNTHNPKTLGHIVNFDPTTLNYDLTDAHREAIVLKTMRLLSTRYSYYTIIGAAELNGTTESQVYAFVRRNNDTGKVTIIRKYIAQ
ncbi:MAG: hypothetical protein NE334_15955 [Lentisphaeraceae bacterium]|nr:hypothetical protein [Lentisphaeraceae bacterium]